MNKICSSLIVLIALSSNGCEIKDKDSRKPCIYPTATGAISYMPEVHLKSVSDDNVKSDYFKTTALNRTIRRGFIEYMIDVDTNLVSAFISVTRYGVSGAYLPPNTTHEISYYVADLLVDTMDFDRSTTILDTIISDETQIEEIFEIEITELIKEYNNHKLGFRINIIGDLDSTRFTNFGDAFGAKGYGNYIEIHYQ